MTVDFDKVYDRVGTGSYKWDVKEGELSLNVADMDFPVSENISKRIQEVASFPIYGYVANESENFKRAVVEWFSKKHGFRIEDEDMIGFALSVLSTVSSSIQAFSKVGEKVLMLSPIYNAFFTVINELGREVLECPLDYKDGEYSINWQSLEEGLQSSKIFLLSNPHNPTGQTFSKEELRRFLALSRKYEVLIISDEIHQDLLDDGLESNCLYPLAQNYDLLILASSPTKPFNVAGIQTSYYYAKNEKVFKKLKGQVFRNSFSSANIFSFPTLEACYLESQSLDWLKQLNFYVSASKKMLKNYLRDNSLDIIFINQGALYLVWLEVSCYFKKVGVENSLEFCEKFYKSQGVKVSPGFIFSKSFGKDFIRVNLATSKVIVLEFLSRLKKFIQV